MSNWQPPSESDFNDKWFTPLEAVDALDADLADSTELWKIVEQLRAGQVIAVARTSQLRPDLAVVVPFSLVPAGAWRRMMQNDEYRFWRTGCLVVDAPPSDLWANHREAKERYFDIRFDPESFSGKPPPIEFGGPGPTPPLDTGPVGAGTANDLKPVSANENMRLAKAIAHGWGDVMSESEAWAAAKQFRPNLKIPKHPFLVQFRIFRGAKSRGKPPKTG